MARARNQAGGVVRRGELKNNPASRTPPGRLYVSQSRAPSPDAKTLDGYQLKASPKVTRPLTGSHLRPSRHGLIPRFVFPTVATA